jgi:hypothetical protein
MTDRREVEVGRAGTGTGVEIDLTSVGAPNVVPLQPVPVSNVTIRTSRAQGLQAVSPRFVAATEAMEEDLGRSGLVRSDLNCHLAGESELAACGLQANMYLNDVIGTPGYIIPYYNMSGTRIPFYRMRIFKPAIRKAKYMQPRGSSSYTYFAPNFLELLMDSTSAAGRTDKRLRTSINGFRPALIITEGEKKAAKAVKEGFLTVGLGGVFNWKTNKIVIPKEQIITDTNTGDYILDLAQTEDEYGHMKYMDLSFGAMAAGMEEVIRVVKEADLQVIILYDSENSENRQVQIAAAQLAHALRVKGVPIRNIRQAFLPLINAHKEGLDDFLCEQGPEALQDILHDTMAQEIAFPGHPDIREYVNRRLQNKNLPRDAFKELAISVVADMDSCGKRMRDEELGSMYYFDRGSKILSQADVLVTRDSLSSSSFGHYLYNRFGFGQSDVRFIDWFTTVFNAEPDISNVSPRSCIAVLDDAVAYQINDGQFALVTSDEQNPILICDNGYNDILFKAGAVKPIRAADLATQLKAQLKEDFTPWWQDTLGTLKFVNSAQRDYLACLSYISPWLLRWRGAQLPVEIGIGEPGSGKSSLYMLRSNILLGDVNLLNQPNDFRDWYAAIGNAAGMHITDNVQFTDKIMKQRFSDELCRLITEPNPTVIVRKLYTTAEVAKVPVRCTMVFTAIHQPFINPDILQRSFVFELAAIGDNFDSDWPQHQMASRGGRTAWIAHHLIALHKFLKQAKTQWSTVHRATHRLSHFEQVMTIMADAIGIKMSGNINMRTNVAAQMTKTVTEYDWVIKGLKEFAIAALPKMSDSTAMFAASDITDWAIMMDDYVDNNILNNARKLGRYIKSYTTQVRQTTGIYEVMRRNNVTCYRVDPKCRLGIEPEPENKGPQE